MQKDISSWKWVFYTYNVDDLSPNGCWSNKRKCNPALKALSPAYATVNMPQRWPIPVWIKPQEHFYVDLTFKHILHFVFGRLLFSPIIYQCFRLIFHLYYLFLLHFVVVLGFQLLGILFKSTIWTRDNFWALVVNFCFFFHDPSAACLLQMKKELKNWRLNIRRQRGLSASVEDVMSH